MNISSKNKVLLLPTSLSIIMLAMLAGGAWTGAVAQESRRASSDDPLVVSAGQLARPPADGYRSLTTHRQECRVLVVDSKEQILTVGVTSNDSDTLNRTRQFVVLGRYENEHWVDLGKVSTHDGYVYYPAAAADQKGGIWMAWAEFNEIEQNWDVFARYFDGDKFDSVTRVSSSRGPDLRPAITVDAQGKPLVAWESGKDGAFQIMAAYYQNGHWQEETITRSRESNFRPFVAQGSDGATWLAWDRFVQGDYDVYLASRQDGKWSEPIAFLSSNDDEQRPTIRVGRDKTLWVHGGKRVVGLRNGQRIELPKVAQDYTITLRRLDEFQIDPSGRLWFFETTQGYNPGKKGTQGGQTGEMSAAWFDGERIRAITIETHLGYRTPVFDSSGALWHATDFYIFSLSSGVIPDANPVTIPGTAAHGPVAEKKPDKPAPTHVPHINIDLDGQAYTLFWGEQHTHLTEFPPDRLLETRVDRFYLSAAQSGVLDFAALSDHDFDWMTNSKYRTQQAYASVLSEPGEFQSFAGYEWSGDYALRRRYGDRTIVFSGFYSPIFRITDPESDTPLELHRALASIGAISWAHHVGAPWAVMDWKTHDPIVEPVSEVTSVHGVYETYDRDNAVPDWMANQPVGKTSIHDGLATGTRFGLVGSSDSHSGISGYHTGMLGVFAKSLTRESILKALRNRRCFAVRGGEPIFLDFRVNGSFMGGESPLDKTPPLIVVEARAQSAINKIEVVRNGSYIYTYAPKSETTQARFSYKDTAEIESGTYYYVRVWLEGQRHGAPPGTGGKYAWSSPVWID